MILLMQSFTAHYPHAVSGGNQGIRIMEKMLSSPQQHFIKVQNGENSYKISSLVSFATSRIRCRVNA